MARLIVRPAIIIKGMKRSKSRQVQPEGLEDKSLSFINKANSNSDSTTKDNNRLQTILTRSIHTLLFHVLYKFLNIVLNLIAVFIVFIMTILVFWQQSNCSL